MSGALSEVEILKRASNAAFRELDGKLFVVGAADTKLVQINETGAVLWAYLDQPRPLGQLADRLVTEFQVERPQALEDCRTFVESMLTRGLIVQGDQEK